LGSSLEVINTTNVSICIWADDGTDITYKGYKVTDLNENNPLLIPPGKKCEIIITELPGFDHGYMYSAVL
jgi:hypothetical protein